MPTWHPPAAGAVNIEISVAGSEQIFGTALPHEALEGPLRASLITPFLRKAAGDRREAVGCIEVLVNGAVLSAAQLDAPLRDFAMAGSVMRVQLTLLPRDEIRRRRVATRQPLSAGPSVDEQSEEAALYALNLAEAPPSPDTPSPQETGASDPVASAPAPAPLVPDTPLLEQAKALIEALGIAPTASDVAAPASSAPTTEPDSQFVPPAPLPPPATHVEVTCEGSASDEFTKLRESMHVAAQDPLSSDRARPVASVADAPAASLPSSTIPHDVPRPPPVIVSPELAVEAYEASDGQQLFRF